MVRYISLQRMPVGTQVYETKEGIRMFSSQKTTVSCWLMARKILKNINGLATQIHGVNLSEI